ncbi:MAG: hypothetical protein HY016_05215 [Nitrosomonadales bacterium]|nr:hypothetical protein [Nitrosomonadales bacterium]
MMNQRALLESAGLFMLAYLALLALALPFGNAYAEFLLPLYRWELGHLAQDYHIQSVMLGESHGEGVVMLSLLTRYSVIGTHVIPPDISISCSTLIGHALQHPLLTLSLAVAWPATTSMQKIVQLCCALPFLLLLELLDIPLILLGSAQDLLIANFAPASDSFMVGWMNFLNGGGRPALSIFAAMMAVICGRMFFPEHSQPSVKR